MEKDEEWRSGRTHIHNIRKGSSPISSLDIIPYLAMLTLQGEGLHTIMTIGFHFSLTIEEAIKL